MSLSSMLKLAASKEHIQSALKNINQQRGDSEMTNMLDHSPRKTGGGDGEKNRNFSQKILKRGDEQCQKARR